MFTMILIDTMISVVYCCTYRDVISTSFPFLKLLKIFIYFPNIFKKVGEKGKSRRNTGFEKARRLKFSYYEILVAL